MNAVAISPRVYLPDPAAALTGEQHLALDEVKGIAYDGIMGGLDGTGDLHGRIAHSAETDFTG